MSGKNIVTQNLVLKKTFLSENTQFYQHCSTVNSALWILKLSGFTVIRVVRLFLVGDSIEFIMLNLPKDALFYILYLHAGKNFFLVKV